jgi:hypothetical protein
MTAAERARRLFVGHPWHTARLAACALTLSCALPIGRVHADAWSNGAFSISPRSLPIEQLVMSATPILGPLAEGVPLQLPAISVPWWETPGGANASEPLRSNTIAWSVALARRGLVGTLKFRF